MDETPISSLVRELKRDNLLPAIVFRTSRSQCDTDVRRAESGRSMLLSPGEQGALEREIFSIAKRYDLDMELISEHQQYSSLLRTGIGAHHAGQLLVWRLLLEELMVSGLLRVLVATGTVAAGVDFPARTVVITAHSKRDSVGYRQLTAAEFQQMSGRAGRRGRDTVGFCVVAPSRFCDAREVLAIAKRKPEPLLSAYFPSPCSVLNLMRYRNVDDLVYTVDRSLAAFMDRRKALELRDEAALIASEMPDTDSGVDSKRRGKKVRRLERQADELAAKQNSLLNATLRGLSSLGYLEESHLSAKGVWASNICTNLVLELSEIIADGMLDDSSPERMTAIVGSISGDSHRRYLTTKTEILSKADQSQIKAILERVRSHQLPGVLEDSEVVVSASYTVLTWMHADSWAEFRSILLLSGVHEGDAARLITQTAEQLNQLTRLQETFPELAKTAERARLRILRPPLTEVLEIG